MAVEDDWNSLRHTSGRVSVIVLNLVSKDLLLPPWRSRTGALDFLNLGHLI